ncbi:efflux RND transporter periplasmic adaptor subunit [Halomonas cerina]|uniref:Multidrug efflux pump subunit AcrA (Membrane-fusion protein) n=1 Tax=Halomonas cerina TaxID=447424 RepID=A0A839V5W4_9GAMM|nr:HlyD family efflux transporter periplasmic adaptor subunit [Halomonas cerina]MBB3189185.1 multidrug efflux pump subunit AcrA (membrane-fusion protein) [Halomonas cerina]
MHKRLIPLAILVLGVAAFLVLRVTAPEPATVVPQERRWRVETLPVSLADHVPLLPLYGEVTAPGRITVTAPLAARVAARPVRDGQRVEAGELLVALDEADVQPPLAQARAEVADLEAQVEAENVEHRSDLEALGREQELLDNARRQWERTRSLVERNLVSRADLDAARNELARARVTVATREGQIAGHPARLKSLEARLARARAALSAARRDAERSRVVAPFDGVVSGVRVAKGDQVAARAELLDIYPSDGLELRARLPQRYQPELLAALEAEERLFATGEDGSRWILEGLAGESDPAGTEAIFRQLGERVGLRPGSLLPVRLQRTPAPATLAVPQSALYGDDALYVVDEESRMRHLAVTRRGLVDGPEGQQWALVAGSALEESQRVIITHLPNAIQGLLVEPVEAPEAP